MSAPVRGTAGSGHLSETDDVTLRTLAVIGHTTVAGQRRKALRAYAEQARRDPAVAEIVRLVLTARQDHSNVIPLRRRPR